MRRIKKVTALYWSATGNTKKIVTVMANTLAQHMHLPLEVIDFTPWEARQKEYSFEEEELLVVGAPTYAGKLPNKILPDFKNQIKGKGTLAIGLVTFGNRNPDHSLAEMHYILDCNGFTVIAAGAFSCQHSFTELLASGRPDEKDQGQLTDMAKELAGILQSDASWNSFAVAGDAQAPYYIPKKADGQPAKFLKAKPKTNPTKCNGCGMCAKVCPMQSIRKEDVTEVSGICIKCHACIRQCPQGAKYMDDPAFLSHVEMLQNHYQTRKDNITAGIHIKNV